jgi:hypothetical protein
MDARRNFQWEAGLLVDLVNGHTRVMAAQAHPPASIVKDAQVTDEDMGAGPVPRPLGGWDPQSTDEIQVFDENSPAVAWNVEVDTGMEDGHVGDASTAWQAQLRTGIIANGYVICVSIWIYLSRAEELLGSEKMIPFANGLPKAKNR